MNVVKTYFFFLLINTSLSLRAQGTGYSPCFGNVISHSSNSRPDRNNEDAPPSFFDSPPPPISNLV